MELLPPTGKADSKPKRKPSTPKAKTEREQTAERIVRLYREKVRSAELDKATPMGVSVKRICQILNDGATEEELVRAVNNAAVYYAKKEPEYRVGIRRFFSKQQGDSWKEFLNAAGDGAGERRSPKPSQSVDVYQQMVAARERLQGKAIAEAHNRIAGGEADMDGVCADLLAELHAAKNSGARNSEAKLAGDILADCLDANREPAFVVTGYERLDALHGGGLAIPSVTGIAAGPSVGKSQCALNFATRMKRDGNPARVLFVSAEMGETEMMCRLVALCGEMRLGTVKTILYGRAHGGTLDAYGWKFEQGALRVKELPLRMIFGCFDADGLKDVAARYSGRFDVFIVDYLQRVGGKSAQKTLERVSAASQACRDIAIQHSAAVIAISSLNRAGAAPAAPYGFRFFRWELKRRCPESKHSLGYKAKIRLTPWPQKTRSPVIGAWDCETTN